MKAAYDELIATAVKRQHEPQRVVGDLLAAEISEKQARSIKYQITIAPSQMGALRGTRGSPPWTTWTTSPHQISGLFSVPVRGLYLKPIDILTPSPAGAGLEADLHGELAGILAVCEGAAQMGKTQTHERPGSFEPGRSVKVGCGGRI